MTGCYSWRNAVIGCYSWRNAVTGCYSWRNAVTGCYSWRNAETRLQGPVTESETEIMYAKTLGIFFCCVLFCFVLFFWHSHVWLSTWMTFFPHLSSHIFSIIFSSYYCECNRKSKCCEWCLERQNPFCKHTQHPSIISSFGLGHLQGHCIGVSGCGNWVHFCLIYVVVFSLQQKDVRTSNWIGCNDCKRVSSNNWSLLSIFSWDWKLSINPCGPFSQLCGCFMEWQSSPTI